MKIRISHEKLITIAYVFDQKQCLTDLFPHLKNKIKLITAWPCTHIPNIIDLSGKIKKLWSRQASLRRSGSGRKNQTKTICLPSLEGET
jgi:hypothetical protein